MKIITLKTLAFIVSGIFSLQCIGNDVIDETSGSFEEYEGPFATLVTEYWCKFKKEPNKVEDFVILKGPIENADPVFIGALKKYLTLISIEGSNESIIISYEKSNGSQEISKTEASAKCNQPEMVSLKNTFWRKKM